VVDASKIPSDQHLGIIARDTNPYFADLICTDTLRRLAARQDFVGLRFESIDVITHPRALVPHKGQGMSKAIMVPHGTLPFNQTFDVDAHLREFPNNSYGARFPGANALSEYVMFVGDDDRVIEQLLKSGCQINIGENKLYATPVLLNMPMRVSLIKLMQEYGANWNTVNCLGITPLMSAMRTGRPAAIELLLSLGANPLARDANGDNVMHHLAENASIEPSLIPHYRKVARILVRAHARLDERNRDGHTPIDIVIRSNDWRLPNDQKTLVAFGEYLKGLLRRSRSGSAAASRSPRCAPRSK
jgi:ankyrin repeat protein